MDLKGWNRGSTWVGIVLWLGAGLLYLNDLTWLSSIDLLLFLAFFVIAPSTLALVGAPDESGWPYRSAAVLQPFAALCAAASFAVGRSVLAGVLVLPWMGFTGLVALHGLQRFWARRGGPISEVCIDLGLLYLPVGAVWLLMAQMGAQPLNFGELIVLLTAVHFHFIPLTALILTGLVGRKVAEVRPSVWPIYRVAALGVIIGPLLVAGGITISGVALESVAAVVLGGSLVTVGVLALRFVLPATHPRTARTLLVVSSCALFFAMTLAIAYPVGRWTGAWGITIPRMVQGHGWVNALGFGLCGLVAWRLASSRG